MSMTDQHSPVVRIAIFASGTGSNTQKIIDYFRSRANLSISLILTNNPQAGVLDIAARERIPSVIIDREKFFRTDTYIRLLEEKKVQWVVLAGFLWKIPSSMIRAFPEKIINIHPALLPKYGGKGMYGAKVHEAVIAAGEKLSGITIHYVDEIYDHGGIIFQASCEIEAGESPESLAAKIHALEYQHFPRVIEELVDGKL